MKSAHEPTPSERPASTDTATGYGEHTADNWFECACSQGYESYWTCPDCGNEKPRVDYRAPSCRCGATMILEVAEA